MTDTTDSELFEGDDFVFTQDKDGNVIGGGYKVKSYFLQGGISPMTTYNSEQNEQNKQNEQNEQNGGKVSSPFENLAVPAGLFYVNMRIPKKDFERDSVEHYKPHQLASDEMIDKLYALVEVDKKRKRKTRKFDRKHNTKIDKTKTRRVK